MLPIWKKIRTFSWITSGFVAKRKKILLASAVIGIGFFLFMTRVLPILPQPKQSERIGFVGRYTWATLPLEVQNQMSQGLTAIAQDGSPTPALAQNWQVSDDGKNYTFTLREGLTWQDGTPLKSSDLSYPFSDVSMEMTDEKTIVFHLKEPFAPFPVILSMPVFKDQTVGMSHYKVDQVKKNGEIIDQISLSGPQNIVYKFYPNLETAIQAFKLGEVDTLKDLLEISFDAQWQKNLQIEKKLRNDEYLAAFFSLKDPILADKTMRQALAYAANKGPGTTRALGPINPKSWAYNADVKNYDFDPAKAKDLFDKFFQGGTLEATKSAAPAFKKEDVNLTISTTQTLLPEAEELKKSWTETLGIKVKTEMINTMPDNFQVLLIGQEIPADPDQYPLWHSTQAQNFTHYQSPKVDKLLEDARRILDQNKRKEKYDDFQRFLLEDAPAVFLYHPSTYNLSRHSLAPTL
ncbi:hypothetical protein A2160_01595 [Candidatus Beckwithbacteria bacterium RBG_13_42_9]|uniref:Solute-binding protein family 5 domain-containing protein n=1 Tax=Candidatus Beckwithbacteria bacterium RBG_13_42_9 TaxID=1797457 RepID=A0A1F5E907_9BACT|nr:MAG: hypothetical protein A2160_01595 [Candidatus Beckwithbacteria bacterium RBG_13_42_9]